MACGIKDSRSNCQTSSSWMKGDKTAGLVRKGRGHSLHLLKRGAVRAQLGQRKCGPVVLSNLQGKAPVRQKEHFV